MTKCDELYHYGVLGMKWGMHRKAQKGETYEYHSMRTNRDLRKMMKNFKKGVDANYRGNKNRSEKFMAKSTKYFEDLADSSALDEARVEYAKKTSVGKAVVQGLLFGSSGARNYQSSRAVGLSRGKSLVNAFLTSASGSIAGPAGTRLASWAIRSTLGEIAHPEKGAKISIGEKGKGPIQVKKKKG